MLGKLLRRPAVLDKQLAEELKALHMPEDKWETYIGRTMCTTDFYEGQFDCLAGDRAGRGQSQRDLAWPRLKGNCSPPENAYFLINFQ